ncbi:hypothetical protein PPACK8108_LOCUS23973 [Phakopsora pachyrhizi]|uniref:Uncharacterized protein n=1 Tax=Phakopsora pachyrhizi TaxID=170000 RepID=A0AAV0BRD3_PHAPC|nr:hypothetical protein PPACK8108_LOCUS23973 [Phakopsora pachyrhizi]
MEQRAKEMEPNDIADERLEVLQSMDDSRTSSLTQGQLMVVEYIDEESTDEKRFVTDKQQWRELGTIVVKSDTGTIHSEERVVVAACQITAKTAWPDDVAVVVSSRTAQYETYVILRNSFHSHSIRKGSDDWNRSIGRSTSPSKTLAGPTTANVVANDAYTYVRFLYNRNSLLSPVADSNNNNHRTGVI